MESWDEVIIVQRIQAELFAWAMAESQDRVKVNTVLIIRVLVE